MTARLPLLSVALIATALCLASPPAHAQDVEPAPAQPLEPARDNVHLALRAGYFAATQFNIYDNQFSWGGTVASTFSGQGLSLQGVLTVGSTNFRWLNKLQAGYTTSGDDGSSGGLVVATTGAQYNSAHDQTLGVIVELTLGAAIADGRMSNGTCLQCSYSYVRGQLVRVDLPPVSAGTTAAWIVEAGAGVRILPQLQVMAEGWLGNNSAQGFTFSVGTEFAL